MLLWGGGGLFDSIGQFFWQMPLNRMISYHTINFHAQLPATCNYYPLHSLMLDNDSWVSRLLLKLFVNLARYFVWFMEKIFICIYLQHQLHDNDVHIMEKLTILAWRAFSESWKCSCLPKTVIQCWLSIETLFEH